MNHRNLFLLLGLTVFLSACQKNLADPEPSDPCGQKEFHDLDNFLMESFLFKEGSYWVYADSTSGAIDSIYCYGPRTGHGVYRRGPLGSSKEYCLDYYTYIQDSINQPDRSPYACYIQGKALRIAGPYAYMGFDLAYNNNGTLQGDLHNYYSDITIHAQTYSDVHKFHFSNNNWTYHYGDYYIKPKLGIVKMVLYAEFPVVKRNTLELIRYKMM